MFGYVTVLVTVILLEEGFGIRRSLFSIGGKDSLCSVLVSMCSPLAEGFRG